MLMTYSCYPFSFSSLSSSSSLSCPTSSATIDVFFRYQIFIDVDGNSIKNTPFQTLILSGAIEGSQCYACLLDSTGCRRGQRGDRDATCTRSLKAFGEEVLLCVEASQVTPASLYVRLADRYAALPYSPPLLSFLRLLLSSSFSFPLFFPPFHPPSFHC